MTKWLTQQQKDAADWLAKGVSVVKTAEMVGTSRVSIGKWKNKPQFQEYYNTLVEQREADRKKAATKATVKQEFDRRASLDEWRIARVNANKAKLDCGLEIVEKMRQRFKDLPQECFAPANIAPLLKAGDEMIETAMAGWGTTIDVEEAKPSYVAEIQAIQKLVDAGVLPQSIKEGISVALDEFQRKAIVALSGKVSSAQNLPQIPPLQI